MLKSYDIRVAHKPIGTLSIDDERDCSVKGLGRERRSRRENSRMSARMLWTTSFPCKCSKRLSTVCPKRSIARTLPVFLSSCSFSLFFFLYLAAFFVGQLLLVKIKRAWTSSVSLQVIPVAFSSWRIFALYACISQQGQSVFHESFIDFEFWMIKATQVYSYLVPCISFFLASIRKLEGFHNSVTLLGIAPNHVCLTTPFPLQRKEPKVINVWRQTTSVIKEKKGETGYDLASF